MRLPSTLTFDLDGTLIDTAPDLTHALNHTLATLDLPPVTLEAARPLVGKGARVLIERGAAAGGATLDEAAVDRAFETYIAFYGDHIADDSDVYPHAVETLDLLANHGVIMGVCTNKPQVLSDAILRELDLTKYFGAVVGADAVENRKPHADHLFETVARMGGDTGDCVHIGDSETDIETARNAGVPAVAVTFGYTVIPPHELGADCVIDSFATLPQALSSLLDKD